MVEFSPECQTATGNSFPGDFSTSEEFKRLMESMMIGFIGGNFVSVSSQNLGGECDLFYFDMEPALIENIAKKT